MLTEPGRVVAVESDSLWVETIRQSTCNSCSAQKGCGHGMLNKVGSGRRNHLRVLLQGQSAADFAVDDEVVISIPEQVLVSGALLVYLLPLALMLAGALLFSRFWQGDIAAVAGASLGFVLGFAVVKYHGWRNRDNRDLQPVVMNKLTKVHKQPVQLANPA